MNRMDTARRAQVIRCLVEGNSINSTVRMTGVAKNTVLKLLVEIGDVCEKFLNDSMRNLSCRRIQADEAWSFCFAKQKNVKPEHFEDGGYAGDVWTWVAIDAETKLIPSWLIGTRDAVAARTFMEDLANRLANRVQLTTDGHRAYLTAVDAAFGNDIDYAMLVKIYGETSEGQKRYSPAECVGCERHTIKGRPDTDHISTSYAERQNLTMRMSMRRFTRLTNGFSKKLQNHGASIALYMMFYNYACKHTSLQGRTPAMAAGIADHPWSVEEIVALLERGERNASEIALAWRGTN